MQFRYTIVLELVMLNGRVLFSWIPSCTLSVDTHVSCISGAGRIVNRWAFGLMDSIGYELFSVSSISVPVDVLHWILYNGSPHVEVVLSGNGTVVLPQGGHGVAADITCVAHVSSSDAATRRSLVVVESTGGREERCVFILHSNTTTCSKPMVAFLKYIYCHPCRFQ